MWKSGEIYIKKRNRNINIKRIYYTYVVFVVVR